MPARSRLRIAVWRKSGGTFPIMPARPQANAQAFRKSFIGFPLSRNEPVGFALQFVDLLKLSHQQLAHSRREWKSSLFPGTRFFPL